MSNKKNSFAQGMNSGQIVGKSVFK